MMTEKQNNGLLSKDRLIGEGLVAVTAVAFLLLSPIFGVGQLVPLGVSFLAAIVLSFFHKKE